LIFGNFLEAFLIKSFAKEEKETQKISDSLQESIETSVEQNTISAFSQLV